MTWLWIVVPIILVLVSAGILSFIHWDWLSGDCQNESGSSIIRNLVLTVAAVIALPLAIWRGVVADRQARTAQGSLLNERYQKGAEMLGSEELSVRLGGIYALARLAREHSEDYHVQIMSLLCAFVRTYPVGIIGQDTELREDIQVVMTELCKRSMEQIQIEKKEQYRLDLSEAQLSRAELPWAELWGTNLRKANLIKANLSWTYLNGATLTDADLSGAQLTNAQLTGATLSEATLSRATLTKANLTRAILLYADLTDVVLENANLSRAILKGCKGLTQEQIDQAIANEDDPPNLEGVVDAKTKTPLVWREKPVT